MASLELNQTQLREALFESSAGCAQACDRSTAEFFDHFFDIRLTAQTPDQKLNGGFEVGGDLDRAGARVFFYRIRLAGVVHVGEIRRVPGSDGSSDETRCGRCTQ